MFKISIITLAAVMMLGASAQAQTQVPADSSNPTPTFRITVVSRTTRAVSHRHRSGATKINFQGTDLMPGATGEAKVESKRGALEVEVEFSGLDRPTSFGNEYLTYVLWAISPEGRPGSYLTQQGVPASSTTAAGFGKTRPIASNDTSEGRQLNRRVELIVSGEVIGTKIVSFSLQPVVAVTSPQ